MAEGKPSVTIEGDAIVLRNFRLTKKESQAVLSVQRERGCTKEEALAFLMETGAKAMRDATPKDGQHR